MVKRLGINKFIMYFLILIVIGASVFSITGTKGISHAATKDEINEKHLLEFLKEGYNAYWYLDESLDYENPIKDDNKEYLRVKKNFYCENDIYKYFAKYYTKDSARKFVNSLSAKIINGELYVIAGEAGDKPSMDTGEIIEVNRKKNYVTLMVKDKDNETIYLRAYTSFEDEKLKIVRWSVL